VSRVKAFASAAVAVLTLFGVAGAAGFRVNTSHSFPVGLYRITDDPVAKGRLVMFCPPEGAVFEEALRRGYIGAGLCPGGYGYLIKKILAAQDDRVSIAAQGVTINGEHVPHSAQVSSDPSGRPLPAYRADHLVLADRQVLLLSDFSPRSFDGRYFGAIDIRQIQGVLTPVFTW
jgi:conjugative transfer signal peptidase TraF